MRLRSLSAAVVEGAGAARVSDKGSLLEEDDISADYTTR
jgi:hypothetical protein